MIRLRTIIIAAALLILPACADITILHVGHYDHVPHVGWRHHATGDVCSFQCFDDTGEVLGACAGCYDANKQPIPGCQPGHWDVSARKAELDAKINAKRLDDHCRQTVYGCMCTGFAVPPWTDEQKKVYPACDPSKSVASMHK